MLISRYRERWSFRASFRVSLLPIQKPPYFPGTVLFVADLFPRIPIRILLLPTHADLAIDQFLEVLRVPRSLHRNLRSGAADLAEIVGCQFNGSGADVFFQPGQLRGSVDGN